MKKILIISSDYTGHGHKSITDSLKEQFAKYPDVSVHVVDGFSLGGSVGLRIGKMYGSVTRNAKDIWKLIWDISSKKPEVINDLVELVIKDNFLKLLSSVKPDLILSVHPNYNAPVINILHEYDIKIPFLILIADLVSISPLWADSRADYIICPTIESKYKCIEFGVPESKLKVFGFPVRSKFFAHLAENRPENYYSPDRALECLIMSGGEGVGNMSAIAKILLKNFNVKVKIIAGRNTILKRRLERTLLEKYGERVEIYGFVENLHDMMVSSDIVFTRGSPNVVMEAVACAVPIVVTGALPGQEEGNPGYIEKYNLGVVCDDTKNLKNTVNLLLENNAARLKQIKQAQQNFRNPNTAADIVKFILSVESGSSLNIPDFTPKMKRIIKVRSFMLKK